MNSAPSSLEQVRLKRLREKLDEGLASSWFPWWEWDIAHNRVSFNDLKVSMLGYDPADFKNVGYQAFTNLLHREDFERTMQAMRDHLEGRTPIYQVDYRIRRADGAYQWYMDRGCVLKYSADKKPLLLRGLVLDLGPEFHRRSQDAVLLQTYRNALPKPDASDSLITICSVCTRLKISENRWVPAADPLVKGFPLGLSHGLCGDCIRTLYPEAADLMQDG